MPVEQVVRRLSVGERLSDLRDEHSVGGHVLHLSVSMKFCVVHEHIIGMVFLVRWLVDQILLRCNCREYCRAPDRHGQVVSQGISGEEVVKSTTTSFLDLYVRDAAFG